MAEAVHPDEISEVREAHEATATARAWLAGEYVDDWAGKTDAAGSRHVLRLAGHNPADTFVVHEVFDPAFRVLERMSHGRLRVQALWGGTSHALTDGWHALRSGHVDITACYAATQADELGFDLVQGLYLPGLFRTAAVGTLASQLLYREYLKPEYDRQGVRMGRLKATASDVLFSTRPIRALEDLRGLRIGCGAGWHGAIYRALGAEIVPTPSPAMRGALLDGTLQAVAMTDGSAKVFGVHEATRFRLAPGLGRLNLEYCLSPAVYDALPRDLQEVLAAWLAGLSQAESQVFYGLGGAMARVAFREACMSFTKLSAPERARWDAGIADIREAYADTMERKGLPARRMLADAMAINAAHAGSSNNELMAAAIAHPVPRLNDH